MNAKDTLRLEDLEAQFKDLVPYFNEQAGRKDYAGRDGLYSWGTRCDSRN